MNSILYYCTILLYLFFSFIVNKIIKYFSTLFLFIYYLQLAILSSSHQRDQKKRRNPKPSKRFLFCQVLIVFSPTVRLWGACVAAVVKQDQIPYYQAYTKKSEWTPTYYHPRYWLYCCLHTGTCTHQSFSSQSQGIKSPLWVIIVYPGYELWEYE